jgi:hypothetical protein
LLRIFSIALWYHFAYLILSIAMLGFAASGTLLSILQPRPGTADRLFAPLALGTAVAEIGGLALALALPFEPFLIVWEPGQAVRLLAFYFLLGLPFGLGGAALALALIGWRRVGTIYFADLTGAGLGAVLVTLMLYWLEPGEILAPLSAAAAVSAALAARRKSLVLLALLIALTAPAAAARFVKQKVSPYKGLTAAVAAAGSTTLARAVSPLAVLDAVAGPTVRYAPGLSLNFTGRLPEQIGLFADGDHLGSLTQSKGADLSFLDFMTTALPYRLLREPSSVLILGAGGGMEVLSGLEHGAKRVIAVELDREVIRLVRGPLSEYAGDLYHHPRVEVRLAEARRFLESTSETFDLISISLLDSFVSSSSGVHAASESYLYTVEALDAAMDRLTPNGLLAITRWIKTPPRDVPRLFHTLAATLERRGVASPGDHLAGVRSWATATLLLKKSPLTGEDIDAIRRFGDEGAFDRFWDPHLAVSETNRYHQLPEPFYAVAAREILSTDRQSFVRGYPFRLDPAVDDRPYFFHFFRWDALPVLVRELGVQWIPFIEWGYIILLAVLLQAAIASVLLVLGPIALAPRLREREAMLRSRVALYFGCLGLGYLFLEIALIQKFTLFLSHPVLSATTVLGSMLFFSGLGSLFGERFRMAWVVSGIAGLATVYALILPLLFGLFLQAADPVRTVITVVLLAPLAFLMGMPFPRGLARVKSDAAPLAPWAWAVNGCASVMAPPLATLIAMSFGFRTVLGTAAVVYLVAGIFLYPGFERLRGRETVA